MDLDAIIKQAEAQINDAQAIQQILQAGFRRYQLADFPFSAANVSLAQVNQWIELEQMYGVKQGEKWLGVFRLSEYQEFGLVLSRLAACEQAKGAGKLLLAAAEDQAIKLGFSALQLKTPKMHPFLVNYYLNHGYDICGTSFTPGGKFEEYVFCKQIGPA